jgi:hypothetical protein
MAEVIPSVHEAQDRARRYWESDGLVFLVAGLGLAMLGAGDLWAHSSALSAREEFSADVVRMAAICFLAAQGRVAEWLKARITYPRTGYVAPPQSVEPRPLDLRPDPTLFAAPKQQERRGFERLSWVPYGLLVVGLLSGQRWFFVLSTFLYLPLIWRYRKSPQVSWARKLALPLWGFLLAFLPVQPRRVFAVSIMLAGIYGILMGVLRFSVYLRRHPARSA